MPAEEEHASFTSKSPLERALIAVAGPAANFFLAIAVFWILNLTYGVRGIAPVISDVIDDSPAFLAQLKEDDEILTVDGAETLTWQQVNMKMLARLGETGEIRLTIARRGQCHFYARELLWDHRCQWSRKIYFFKNHLWYTGS